MSKKLHISNPPPRGPKDVGHKNSGLLTRKKCFVISVILVLMIIAGLPLGGHAVKNIFVGFSQITDIKVGGDDIEKVVFRGEVLWERTRLTDLTYLQDLALPENSNACANTPDRTRVTLVDRRNGQQYFVEKINGSGENNTNLCWLETNLRYSGNGNWNGSWGYPDDRYATTAALATQTQNPNDNVRPLTLYTGSGYIGGSAANGYTMASFVDPYARGQGTNVLDVANPTNNTFYGYLYNWCSAMGGQANACNNTSTSGFDISTSICPAGWRLPTGGSGADTDFRNLATVMGGTNDVAGSNNLRNNWLAAYSGRYSMGPDMYGQGTLGA